MNEPGMGLRTRAIVVSLVVNFLLSWTILPFVIPLYRTHSLQELVEVLLWQGMGFVGWPMALLGAFSSLLLKRELGGFAGLLLVIIYPGMLLLLVRLLIPRCRRWWEFILLHLVLTLSFGAVWHQVLNGYDFTAG
jgi:hypothetical protein